MTKPNSTKRFLRGFCLTVKGYFRNSNTIELMVSSSECFHMVLSALVKQIKAKHK